MKTLNKPEIALPLSILGLYFLFLSFGDYILSFFYTNVSNEYVRFINLYKNHFLIAGVILLLFLSIKLYQKKISFIEEQYFDFFLSNPMPMTIVDLDTNKFIAANKAAINIYGYSLKEFLALSIADIRVSEELELMYLDLKTINHGLKKAGIRHHRKKNGEIFLVEVSSSEVVFKTKKCRLLLACNITEIEKAREEKRIAEEEKIRQQNFTSYVVEHFPIDVAVFDKDHKYILLNKTAVKDDVTRKWMIGKDDFDYFRLKGKDMNVAKERRRRFLKAIAGESEEWIDEHIIDGKRKYILRKFFPYYEDGKLKYVYGYGMDITEVKKAQTQRDEYMAQLEKIAFATSHKIRQPICNLSGLISLIEVEKFESQQFQDIISCMQKSVNAMDEFTRELGVKLHEYKQNLAKEENNNNL